MKHSPAIRVDLWPESAWEEGDLRDMVAAASDFGTTVGQRSENLRGTGLHVTISFIAGAVASGFLKALRKDLYEGLRKKLAEICGRPARRRQAKISAGRGDLLAIILEDTELALDLHIYGWYTTESQLGEFLLVAGPAFDALLAAVTEGARPCIRGKRHSVRAEWTAKASPQWSISVQVTESDIAAGAGTPLVTMEAVVDSRSLSVRNWQSIRWHDPRSAADFRIAADCS